MTDPVRMSASAIVQREDGWLLFDTKLIIQQAEHSGYQSYMFDNN